jgi:DNA-directed RNA polymerase specialized sigma subunit
MKVTSCFSDVKVMHSKNEKSQMEKNLVQIVDLSVEINDEINELIRLKSEIAETIREVDDVNCELLLVKRYISGKSWEEIAEEMQYSISGIFRIHGEALKKINKILKRQKKSV